MEIILLKEKNYIPYYSSNVSAVAIRFDNHNDICLFDCGEGTQHYLLQSYVKISQIKRIFISELSSYACFGIAGLLATLSLNEKFTPLEIYAPEGFYKYLRLLTRYSHTNFAYSIKIFTIQEGLVCQFLNYKVIATLLNMSPQIWAYSIIEREKKGKFQIDQAYKLKIPPGSIYGQLKNQVRFILNNGHIIYGKNLCDQPKPGRKLVYGTRLSYSRAIVEFAWRSDIFIVNKKEKIPRKFVCCWYLVNLSEIRRFCQESGTKCVIYTFGGSSKQKSSLFLAIYILFCDRFKQLVKKVSFPFSFKVNFNRGIDIAYKNIPT